MTENTNLFGPGTGIYHNPFQRGLAWERPVAIEFFEPDGTRAFAANGGIRIHGGSSRAIKQKSLRLYARPEYGRDDSFQYAFFPGLSGAGNDQPLDEFKTLLLRNSGNDWHRARMRDVLMQGLVEHSRNLETQASRPVTVFINGCYWGLYHLRERYDENYLALNHGVAPGQVAILERNAELKRGQPADREHYLNLRDYAESHDLSDPEHYRHLAGLMDMRNYIEYYAANIYFHNTDWPHNNIIFWRIRPGGEEPDPIGVRDGRWRWMLQGTDYGFALKGPADRSFNHNFLKEFEDNHGSLSGPAADTLKWAALPLNGRLLEEWPNTLFRNLLANEKFRNGFINHLADQLNSSFHPERVRERIDRLQKKLEPEMAEQCRRWKRMDIESWRENVEVLRWFAAERPDHLRRHVIDHFGLGGTARVNLRADPGRGHLRINRLEITPATPGIRNQASWTGIYFQDVPLRITAVPRPGYRFAGWEGTDQKGAEIELVLKEDVTLTARFAREENRANTGGEQL